MGSTASLLAFARIDARNLRRDSLLVVIGLSPLLLAVALRAGFPLAERWALSAHGLDLTAHRGFALGLIVVLHIPFIFGMLGALLVLDDIDDRILLAVRVTPVTVQRYLGYRLGLVTVVSALGLAVALPVAGLATGASSAALALVAVLAAACAPLATLGTLSLATNKVEGLAVIKVLGLVCYLPLATWFTDATWTVPLMLLPTYWPVRGLWAALDGQVDLFALVVGVIHVTLFTVVLTRRVIRRT